MSESELKLPPEEYRQYLDSIITDIETADHNGNIRKVTRLTKIAADNHTTSKMPSKNLSSTPITLCNEFLPKKFASPDVDLEQTVPQDDTLTNSELKRNEAFAYLISNRTPGWDNIPIEAYKY